MHEEPKLRTSGKGSPAAFQRYPRNCWYVAAARVEVGRTPLGRKLVDKHVVLFRKENGDVVAMDDHCPHRGYRFSDSKVLGDTIQCSYHGMQFDEHGQCIKMAMPGKVPPVMRVATYPTVERWHWIWIWLGDPDKADPASIPRMENEDNPAYTHFFLSPMPFYGNVQLAQDNLLDTTHATYLHPGSLDNADKGEYSTEPVVTIENNVIKRIFDMKGFVANAAMAAFFHVPEGKKVNRRVLLFNHLPCAVNITNRLYAYKDDFTMENPGELIAEQITAIALVPADKNHAYHFTALTTSYGYSESDKIGLSTIVGQDIAAFATIQKHFEEDGDSAIELSVPSDRLGITSRRLIEEMVRREEQEAATA